jgi:hypothetical protein
VLLALFLASNMCASERPSRSVTVRRAWPAEQGVVQLVRCPRAAWQETGAASRHGGHAKHEACALLTCCYVRMGRIPLSGLVRLRGGRYRAELDSIKGAREQRKKNNKAKKRRSGSGSQTLGDTDRPNLDHAHPAVGQTLAELKEALKAKLLKQTAPLQAMPDEATPVPEFEGSESGGTSKKKHRPGSFQALGLDGALLRGMYHAGYKFPTPVQRKVIPHVLSGSHVVAMARTGSGKTAAFLAPMIQRLVSLTAKARGAGRVMGIQGLVLLPTRELALQAFTFFKTYAKFTPISACLMAGGESIDAQFSALAANPEVVIATPGRLLQILNEVPSFHLRGVRVAVLDEADRLFESSLAEVVLQVLAACEDKRRGVRINDRQRNRRCSADGAQEVEDGNALPGTQMVDDQVAGGETGDDAGDKEGSRCHNQYSSAGSLRANFRQMVCHVCGLLLRLLLCECMPRRNICCLVMSGTCACVM